jgi:diacylglycerol kinase (ATP)
VSTYTIVANPAAGKGLAAKAIPQVREAFDRLGMSYEVIETARAGDASKIARSSDREVVVALGGDGTINEVANGIAGSAKKLGIIPAGSGNDFIKSAGIPHSIKASCELLAQAMIRRVDSGTVTVSRSSDGYTSTRIFLNGVGIGFDAAVAKKTTEIHYLAGFSLYLMAVFQTLGSYRAPEFTLNLDHATFLGKNLLIAIGNGRSAGGGFFLTPDAKIDDGLLDACVVQEKNLAQILMLMPLVMRGNHGKVRGVKFLREKKFEISASAPFYVHADGEVVGDGVDRVMVSTNPGAIELMVGRGSS